MGEFYTGNHNDDLGDVVPSKSQAARPFVPAVHLLPLAAATSLTSGPTTRPRTINAPVAPPALVGGRV